MIFTDKTLRTAKCLSSTCTEHVRKNQERRILVAKLLELDPFNQQIASMRQSGTFNLLPVEDAYIKFFERLLKETASLIANCIGLEERKVSRKIIRKASNIAFELSADELQSLTQALYQTGVVQPLLLAQAANHVQVPALLKKHANDIDLRMGTARGWIQDELALRLQRDFDARQMLIASTQATRVAIVGMMVAILGLGFAMGAWKAADRQASYAADQLQLAKCTSAFAQSTAVIPEVKCPSENQSQSPKAPTGASLSSPKPAPLAHGN